MLLPGLLSTDLAGIAERYVRLVLAIGEHDASDLADELTKVAAPDDLSVLRRRALSEQLASIRARLEILRGTTLRHIAMPDGERSKEQTIAWLQEFTFATRSEAEQRLRFYETYRSYIVNYRLGEDLVGQYIDRVAGADPDARWKAFAALLASPPVVSDLARGTTLDPSQ
jgi:hypothetical protein